MTDDFLSILDAALTMTKERRARFPDFDLLQSIEAQLYYLRAVVTEEETDLSRLADIIVGPYGVREFMESDPDYAQILAKSQTIAHLLQDAQI